MNMRRSYSQAFKLEAVASTRVGGKSLTAIARDLGVSRAALNRWVEEFSHLEDLAEAAAQLAHAEQARKSQPTIFDVAEHAGLSKSVVSRALANSYGVSEAARKRVSESAKALGYVHNAMAQGLSSSRTYTIGVLVRDASAPIYGHIQSALQKRASEKGYRVITTTGVGSADMEDEKSALQDLIRLRVEGLVVCSGPLPVDSIIETVGATPVVVAGRVEHDARIRSVFGDEDSGVRDLAEHLVALGHERVAVPVPDKQTAKILSQRAKRLIHVLTELGANVTQLPVQSPQDSQAIVVHAKAQGCTAIAAPNDRYAVEILADLKAEGLEVPGDISVTGFDGISPYDAKLFGLTTWKQPISAIGDHAVDMLLAMIEGLEPQTNHMALPGTVIPRSSTGPTS
ncbi:substrate-binding domain-containing protein [Jonesiaceae bacterium BS-20]|uniref:Substrate-binding domain-containing protein n=1 Tax=Jonesiaceae bacterium BS-20 TaxID=3120821 RepID=A0AAU7DUN1_9MICO